MTNENKLAAMDAVGELPDFGNLLLRESGYPHLDETPKQSQSDAWNDASIPPTECKVYETKKYSFDPDEDIAFQYWNGNFWCFTCGTKEQALLFKSREEKILTVHQWREVQP